MDRYAKLEYCIKHANGWIVRNLAEYGNTVLPKELIQSAEDVRICEKLLSAIMQGAVTIRETDTCGYICQR